jgi:hypothetical protein
MWLAHANLDRPSPLFEVVQSVLLSLKERFAWRIDALRFAGLMDVNKREGYRQKQRSSVYPKDNAHPV